MQIKTYQPENYRGCKVYFRNFQNHFEFLAIVDGEVYTRHVEVRPHWITKILYFIGIEQFQYSALQEAEVIKLLGDCARETVDILLDKATEEIKK